MFPGADDDPFLIKFYVSGTLNFLTVHKDALKVILNVSFVILLAMLAALVMAVLVSPLLWLRPNYLNNYRMDCYEIFTR